MSTGPLGQGVASAVGMALAARREAALFAGGTGILDHTIWVVAGDGCLQEGVSGEASSLAGTLGLDNLVLIWDDNEITIDSGSAEAFSEDVRARYRAYGWRVLEITDHTDTTQIERVLQSAKESDGRPTFVALKTVIGAPSARFGGTSAAHSGGFGAEEVAAVKASLGFAADATLDELVPAEVLAYTRGALERGRELERAWKDDLARWDGAEKWLAFRAGGDVAAHLAALDTVTVADAGSPVATRKTNGAVITALAELGELWGGSADLAGSTNVAVPGSAVSAQNPGGEFIRFGIREHAMAAILTGIALHGPWRPFGSTYLVFSDYMRPSIRLAALMQVPVVYVFTHDSVAVGEDGPTHQPVEQVASLRTVPGLDVIRPADSAEVIAVWRRLLAQPAGPTALILGRQDVPVLAARENLDEGVANGGYVAWQSGAGDQLAIIATGSEVALAIEAAAQLVDVAVRVVSMPSVEWFGAADDAYRESVLPAAVTARVAVEAGRSDGWWRFAGTRGEVIGVESFGESGSGPEILALRGITVDAVLAAARRTLART